VGVDGRACLLCDLKRTTGKGTAVRWEMSGAMAMADIDGDDGGDEDETLEFQDTVVVLVEWSERAIRTLSG
jgi:hypothetical protein